MSDDNISSSQPAQVVTDAAHPLFLEPKQKSVSCSTGNSSKYQCTQCDRSFSRKDASLKKHFVDSHHKPVAECRTCEGGIFEYLDRDKKKMYHKCRKKSIDAGQQDVNQNYAASNFQNSVTRDG